jgi:hypothetical protein
MITMSPARSAGDKNLFDIEQQALSIDGSVDEPGRFDTVVTERGK